MLGLGCLNLNRLSHFHSPPSLQPSRSDLLKVATRRFTALSVAKTQQSSSSPSLSSKTQSSPPTLSITQTRADNANSLKKINIIE